MIIDHLCRRYGPIVVLAVSSHRPDERKPNRQDDGVKVHLALNFHTVALDRELPGIGHQVDIYTHISLGNGPALFRRYKGERLIQPVDTGITVEIILFADYLSGIIAGI